MPEFLATLPDALRWWAAGGAATGGVFVASALLAISLDASLKTRWTRALPALLLVCSFGLAAILIAGTMIPWASAGRLTWFTRESFAYRLGIAGAWLFWGCFAWGVALWFTRRRGLMMGCASAWLVACYLAAEGTAGGVL